MKKLNKTGLQSYLVSLAYRSFVESVCLYGYPAFSDRLTKKDKREYLQVNREAVMMGFVQTGSIENLLKNRVSALGQKILETESHPLHGEITKHCSTGPRHSFKMIYCRTSRFLQSLIPQTLMNLSCPDAQ